MVRAAIRLGLDPSECAELAWKCAILLNRVEEAWSITDRIIGEWRALTGTLPFHRRPVWNGSPVSGKRVLVRCHHGLGDTIQFLRFMPNLRSIVQFCTLSADPCLIPLLRNVPDIDRVVFPGREGRTPDYDVDLEIMELPHILRLTGTSLFGCAPYLHASSVSLDTKAAFKIGIAWAPSEPGRERALPVELFQPLNLIHGVAVYALQCGPRLAELSRPGSPYVENPQRDCADVSETSSIITGLDLVITVDTMVAHLAGALGAKVWMLLPEIADWRWSWAENETPWYPTMRIFRRAGDETWSELFSRVLMEVRSLAL